MPKDESTDSAIKTSVIISKNRIGKIIAEKDWSTTILGDITNWSSNLRGLINIVVESRFPMFVFWGDDNLCFYNDSYAQSLSADFDHKDMIGTPGAQFWGSVWVEVAEPKVKIIKAGGNSTWDEDQLVPIYRNGDWEDVYWTYSYSPCRNGDGIIDGVLVTVVETTEKVLNRLKLEESRDEFRFALDAAGLASFVWNPLTNIFKGNDILKSWFGLKNTDNLDIDEAIKYILPKDQTRVRTGLQNAIDSNTSGDYDIIYTIAVPELPERIVRAVGKCYFNQENEPVRFNGVIRDITKQFLIEREQKKLLALIDSSNEFIILTDVEGKVTTLNPAVKDALALISTSNLHITDLIYIEDKHKVNTLINFLASSKDNSTLEIRFWNAETRTTIWVLFNMSVIKDSQDEEILAFAITGSNITSQKQREDLLIQSNTKLKESENRFKLLSDNAPVFIYMSDIEGTATFSNKLLTDFLGVSHNKFKKKMLCDFIHPKDLGRYKQAYDKAIQKETQFKVDFRIGGKDGLYRWISDIAVPQFDGNKVFEGYTHASLIIHDLKIQEEQKDLFIGMASHELKTPVTSIKGYVQLLKMKYASSDDLFLVKTLATVESQILVLTSPITDLLDLSKMKSGGLNLKKSKFDLVNYISEVLSQQKLINEYHNFKFSSNLSVVVEADKDRIGQVLINFISNAIKYAPDSKIIDIDTAINDKMITVSVKDYGIGINKVNQKKVFNRFFREEGTDEKTFSGFGIGLFIASDIIKKHNGRIGVESIKGEGSTFYFSLPFEKIE